MKLKQKIFTHFIFYIVLFNLLMALLLMTKMQNLIVIISIIIFLNILLIILTLRSVNILITPLQKVIKMLESIIKGKKKRIEVNSPSEISSLVNKVNYLLDMHETAEKNLREAQEQINKTQRWVMLGRLASGVVHEINNPLDGVINCIHTLQVKPLAKKQTRKYLNLVAEGLFRIETITKRLLGLSRDRPLSLVSTNINELIEKALFFVDYRMTQKRISLRCKFTSNLPKIDIDHGAILQVLVNLCLNAIESMPKGGVLSIATTFDKVWLKIVVADTGVGVSADDLNKIFLPFFTTRKEGIGLGLSICLNIVEQHMGEIEVKSILNKGTVFTVKLPLNLK